MRKIDRIGMTGSYFDCDANKLFWRFEHLIPFCLVVVPIYLHSECSPLGCVGTKVRWPLCKPMIANGTTSCCTKTAAAVERGGVECSNFHKVLVNGLSFILHLQSVRIARGLARSRRSALVAWCDVEQHFWESEVSSFFKASKRGFLDLKGTHVGFNIVEEWYKTQIMTWIVVFGPPLGPPLSKSVFLAAPSRFLADFGKVGVGVLRGSGCIQWGLGRIDLKHHHFIAHHYLYTYC